MMIFLAPQDNNHISTAPGTDPRGFSMRCALPDAAFFALSLWAAFCGAFLLRGINTLATMPKRHRRLSVASGYACMA